MLRFTPNIVRLGISALSLLAAIAVYLLLRLEPPALLEPFQSSEKWFLSGTAMFGSAPSFFYTLSIGLLVGAVAANFSAARMHCLAWTAVALILELTQHSGIASLFADAVTGLLPVSISEIILPYWSRGSFDWLDLLATAAGGLFALAILRYVADGGEPGHG